MANSSNTAGGGPIEATPGSSVHVASVRLKDTDEIFEELVDVEYNVYEDRLEELVEIGFLTRGIDAEDRTLYRAREGLSWSDVARLDCPVKKAILLCLIDNPRAFFILYNTQKGKSAIVAKEIKSWAMSDKKVVSFLIADNDKSLADQTAAGLIDEIKVVAHVFTLSSNSKVSFDEVRTYVDAYAADTDGEYKMPVVVALNNTDQIKKVLKLMNHIKVKVESRGSPLRYGVVFDEADKVYPPMRAREFALGAGVVASFRSLLVDNDVAVHRLGFVTATDGDLLENTVYEECANAHMYDVPVGDDNYRAIHLPEAVVKYTAHRRQDNNDTYAEQVLADNKEYFSSQVVLKNGTNGFRKVIVNGGARTAGMKSFASRRVAEGWHAITLNMLGVTVFRAGETDVRRSSKGIPLGKLLYALYTELGLHDKPLIIIGRRKVDRGLGFHYAPRDGSDGLVWTDMILGRIEDKNTAVQKAGRLAGVVAQCPQYPGQLTWWTDERTANTIAYHNQIVDVANTQRGCSALQAVSRASASVERPQETPKAPSFKISDQTFDTPEDAKAWWKNPVSAEKEPHDPRFDITRYRIYDMPEGKCIKYRGGFRRIVSEKEARQGAMNFNRGLSMSARIVPIDIGQGTEAAARIMPVVIGQDLGREGTGVARIMPVEATDTAMIKYIVVYKPGAVYKPRASGGGDSSSVATEE